MAFKSFTGILIAGALAAVPAARAEGQQNPQAQASQTQMSQPQGKQNQQNKQNKQNKQQQKQSADNGITPKLGANEVMRLTQQATAHIAAAEKALEQGNKAAAKSALAKSQQALRKLYDTPPLDALMDELDEAINALSGKQPAVETLDLAPLTASVTSYQAYIDPEVAAGVERAQQRAKQGDAKGTQEELRLARNRVAIDVALLPVEEAYVRVLGAQQALQTGDTKTAKRLLRNVPVVVGEVQIAQPLVPVRFKLQAAAEAAEAKQWDRSRTLLNEANQQVQQLETLAKDSEMKSELTPIANDLERMTRQAQAGTNPQPAQIRELAKRTRSIGMDDKQDKQG